MPAANSFSRGSGRKARAKLEQIKMKNLMNMARLFRDDENGAAMVEYSILIGIIAGAAILAIVAIGLWVSGRFGGLCDVMGGAAVAAATGGTCDKAAGTGS